MNESSIDRIIRLVLALAAAAGAYLLGFGTVLGIALLVVAGVMLLTAVTGYCPMYRLLGLSTCRHHPVAR